MRSQIWTGIRRTETIARHPAQNSQWSQNSSTPSPVGDIKACTSGEAGGAEADEPDTYVWAGSAAAADAGAGADEDKRAGSGADEAPSVDAVRAPGAGADEDAEGRATVDRIKLRKNCDGGGGDQTSSWVSPVRG